VDSTIVCGGSGEGKGKKGVEKEAGRWIKKEGKINKRGRKKRGKDER
jgi:hypothetical protein